MEFLTVTPIAVAQYIARRSVLRESLKKLPGGGRICSHSKMKRTPTIVGKNHEDEQKQERNCRNHEDVGRDRGRYVVLQKGPPVSVTHESRALTAPHGCAQRPNKDWPDSF